MLTACSGGTDGTKGASGSSAGSAGNAAVTALSLLAGTASGAGATDGSGSSAAFSHPAGIATDGAGNIYVADAGNDTVRKITPSGLVTTVAGDATASGSADGSGSAAKFNFTLSVGNFTAPAAGLAADGAGNLYVADTGNHAIRKISLSGAVTTIAGQSGAPGSDNGNGTAARFAFPMAVAVATDGTVYVADSGNHTIRRIATDGSVTTLAGQAGTRGRADGTGTAARFFLPSGLAIDRAGNLFVSDAGNHTIRRITPAGVVSTFAGQGGTAGAADGTGTAATFRNPGGLGIDGNDTLLVTDSGHTVRRVSAAGEVTTLAGSASAGAGSLDGTGANARFNGPYAVAADSAGNVYVSDQDNHVVRKIETGALVTTLAGQAGNAGSADGFATSAAMAGVQAIAADGAGNAYLADAGNNTIRKVTAIGEVTTLAGNASATAGSADGLGTAATFNLPTGVATDALGNVYVADTGNHTIRKITPAGAVTTLAGTAGAAGADDGTGAAARFNQPMGLVVDAAGTIYVCDAGNHTLRRVTAAGVVTTIAGAAGAAGSTDGNGGAARFVLPWGIAADPSGNLYVADPYNNAVRRLTAGGEVVTLAGRPGTGRFAGGSLPGQLTFPTGVAVSGTSLYISLPTGVAVVRNLTF